MLVILLAVLLVAVVVLAAFLCWRPHPLRPSQRVVVSLHDGSAVAGLLWERRGPYLVVRDVTVQLSDQRVAADGSVVVHRDQVRFVQVV